MWTFKMSPHYSPFSEVTNLLTTRYLFQENMDSPGETVAEDPDNYDESSYDLNELEEVFNDHLLMGQRLQKTLYGGDFDDLCDIPDHPPIALTGLAFELFTKAAPNYGLDILDMDYVSSASEAAKISPCAMIVAMIYLERLQVKNGDYLETVSPSGLFVVTMLVASKFLFENEEDIVTNQMWADALNIDVNHLNSLEREFLSAIDWKLLVNSSDYFHYLSNVEKAVAVRQSSLRGWCSYSDICAIIEDGAFCTFWLECFRRIAKVTVFWTLGYVATAFVLYTTGISLHRYTRKVTHSSKYFVPGNDTSEIQTSIHPSVELYLPSEESSDSHLLTGDFSQMHSLNFESSVLNEQQDSETEEMKLSCVFSSYYASAYVHISSTPSCVSKKGIANYKPQVRSYRTRINLTLTNHALGNNVHWLQMKHNNCVSVLVR